MSRHQRPPTRATAVAWPCPATRPPCPSTCTGRTCPLQLPDRTWPDRQLDRAPRWASVDLRDGNQALIDPMDPDRKLALFETLVEHGLQGDRGRVPRRPPRPTSTSCARSSKRTCIPDDVAIQVLVQCREELIERTYESLRGRPAGHRALLQLDLRRCSGGWSSASTRPASSTSPSTRPGCARSSRRRCRAPRSATSTRPRASPAPSPTSRSRSARRSWTSSSRRPSAR